jgi:arabinogalactan endo-1,4-beta-galactosidase
MLDFHFSDTWADPGQQNIPAAWADMTLDEVKTAMTAHINDLLTKLKYFDITPEWVQIGNETRTGMMKPIGGTDQGDNFAQLVSTGYDAVKAVFPDALVIVHCDSGDNQYLYDRLFGQIVPEGAKFDMIGMSLYPDASSWQATVDACMATVEHCQSTYNKPVMICEVGMDYNEEEASAAMLNYLQSESVKRDVKGIFWWEPETPTSYGYKKGCFDDNGAPTSVFDCFKN